MSNPEYYQEKEVKKRRYLVIGVWVFAVIIFFLWLGNLRFSFQSNPFNISFQEKEAWQEDLDESMSYFQANLNSLNEANRNSRVNTESQIFLQNMTNNLMEQKMQTEIISNEFQELEIMRSESDKLLKNLENKINNNSPCPVFINCMPGPDRVGPCSVPPGCEDITQIAY